VKTKAQSVEDVLHALGSLREERAVWVELENHLTREFMQKDIEPPQALVVAEQPPVDKGGQSLVSQECLVLVQEKIQQHIGTIDQSIRAYLEGQVHAQA